MVCHKLKQLVDMQWALLVNAFTEKLQKLVCHYWINFILIRLFKSARNFAFILFQIHNFFFDYKFLRIS